MNNLKPEQQKLIETFISEFESFNAMNNSDDSLLAYLNEKICKDDTNRLFAKIQTEQTCSLAETYLDNIANKLQPVIESFGLEITKSYSGMGTSRTLFISIPYISKDFGKTKKTFDIVASYDYKYIDGFSYPVFDGTKANKTYSYRISSVEQLTKYVCDWIASIVGQQKMECK